MATTTGAAQVELRREYRKWVTAFWQSHTTLSQIVLEDFPDPDDPTAQPTRYQVDAMRDLALSEGALVTGYDQQ